MDRILRTGPARHYDVMSLERGVASNARHELPRAEAERLPRMAGVGRTLYLGPGRVKKVEGG